MKYIEVVFWIENDYDKMNGWKDDGSQGSYYQELKSLLGSVGWKVTGGQNGKRYPVAKKGGERLELKPQYLHGIILDDSPKKIAKLLSMAKTFRYRRIEVLSAVKEMSAAEYLVMLKTRQKEMAEDILTICEGRSEQNAAAVDELYAAVEKKYHIQRAGEIGGDVILKGIFENLLSALTVKGILLEGEAGNGEKGYRCIRTEAEKVA